MCFDFLNVSKDLQTDSLFHFLHKALKVNDFFPQNSKGFGPIPQDHWEAKCQHCVRFLQHKIRNR